MYCNFSLAHIFAILLSLLHVVSHLSIFHFLPQFGIFKCKHTHYLLYTQLNISQVFTVWQAGICPTLFHSHSHSYPEWSLFRSPPTRFSSFKVMSFACVLKSESLTNLFTLRTISNIIRGILCGKKTPNNNSKTVEVSEYVIVKH